MTTAHRKSPTRSRAKAPAEDPKDRMPLTITEASYDHIDSIGALMASKAVAVLMLLKGWQLATPEQTEKARAAVTTAKKHRKKLDKVISLTRAVDTVLERVAGAELCTKALAIDLIVELWLHHLEREQLLAAKTAAAQFNAGDDTEIEST